jgi:hypothetical protein
MDYLIEVRTWSVGFDEAEELTDRIAQLCADRGLALRRNDGEETIRCLVSLKPQGERLDASEGKASRVIARAARGAQLLVVPSAEGMLYDRPRT